MEVDVTGAAFEGLLERAASEGKKGAGHYFTHRPLITWLKDDSLEDSDEIPEPQDLAVQAITELEAVVDDFREIVALVEKEEGVEK